MKTTKAQGVFAALADEITLGRLLPGTPLEEVAIAARFEVSRTPVREALRQLQQSGLVVVRPHHGAVVRAIPEQQLDAMFAVMAELEAVSARWAAAAMTTAERRTLRKEHAAAAAIVKAGDQEGYSEANERFHAAIYAGAHNDYLAELVASIRTRVARFRRAQFDEPGRLAKSHAEHGRVVQAIERAEGQAAYDHMRAHISVVRTAVETLQQAPLAEAPVERVKL